MQNTRRQSNFRYRNEALELTTGVQGVSLAGESANYIFALIIRWSYNDTSASKPSTISACDF
jgi:hypothetical protein